MNVREAVGAFVLAGVRQGGTQLVRYAKMHT